MKIKKMMLLIFILILILISLRCDTTEPPQSKASLTLTLEDVSCTEAWLTLRTEELTLPAELVLKQYNPSGDSFTQILLLSTKDSLLYLDSLLPKQTYVFQVSSIKYQVSSIKATATTLDTTSHNFTWQTWTFGDHSSSVLYDVAIINENNIWAVGKIYMRDSLGNIDHNAYNAVHWDGSQWELKRIKTNACGGVDYPPIQSVFAFSFNDVLFAHTDGSITRYNGIVFTNDCSLITQLNGSANKMWGRSKNDFYVVSGNGFIAHYQNGVWKKIESPTTVDLLDVWGSPDGSFVWTCGYYNDKPGTYLLRSKGGNFEMAYDGTANEFKILADTISGTMVSIYTPSSKKIFIGSSTGVYNALPSTKGKGQRMSFTTTFFPGFPFRLRGNGYNDLIIIGEYSFIAHYNGFSWRYYDELLSNENRLLSVAQHNNLIVAVGYKRTLASPSVLFLGRR